MSEVGFHSLEETIKYPIESRGWFGYCLRQESLPKCYQAQPENRRYPMVEALEKYRFLEFSA